MGDFYESNSANKVPDFILRIGEKKVGVFEIELTQKSDLRYFKIFNRHFRNAKCDLIYFCATPAIANSVLNSYKRVECHLQQTEGLKAPK